MAEFVKLPEPIQHKATTQIAPGEQVLLCFIAGSPGLSSGDYVILTDSRLLVLEERCLGSLNASYINVQCDIPFDTIQSIQYEQRLRHRLFRQMTLRIQVDARTYLIDNVSYREGMYAIQLMRQRSCAHHDCLP